MTRTVALVFALGLCGAPSPASPPSPAAYDAAMARAVRADLGATIPLPDGKMLWVFGDASRAGGKPVMDAHQAFALQVRGHASFRLLPGTIGHGWQQVPDWPGGDFFWGATGAADGRTLYVIGSRIRVTGPGSFGFTQEGEYAAEFSWPSLRYERIAPVPDDSSWGSMTAAGDRGWWVTGTRQTGVAPCYGQCKTGDVAWVPRGKIAGPGAWRVDHGVIPPSLHPGTVVSLMRDGSAWIAWTKRDDLLSAVIERLSAPSPLGPWVITGTWPAPQRSGAYTYSAQAHPGEGEPPGKILVTYAESGGSPLFLVLPEPAR